MVEVCSGRSKGNGSAHVINVFTKESLIKGRPARIECLEVEGQTYSVSRGPATVVRLEDEWHEDVHDPDCTIAALKNSPVKVDIFTFWQRLPDTQPRFHWYREWESIAALPVTTFEHWWNKQIKAATRNLVRKSEKKGVEVREAAYDDDFVRGMTEIFNETPVRQGKRFWHYGKDFETIKRQFSRYLFRETLIGAYHEGELIGFVMLSNAKRYAEVGQIISKIRHRDKSPNNALLAKAVDICGREQLPYLVYARWSDGSLADFKRHNGFEEMQLPRYYVPMTRRGQLAIAAGLHSGWKELLPVSLKNRLKSFRSRWLSLRHA
jgi:hypothetical protein